MKSVYAGLLIGISGYVFLAVGGQLGAFLFAIGLLTVIELKLNLYTGKVCGSLNAKLIPMLFANFIGAGTIGLFGLLNDEVSQCAVKICNVKLDKPIYSVLFDSILCGMFIGIAVKAKQWYITVLAVVCFILAGCEHCIADFFYFVAGDTINVRMVAFMIVAIIGNTIGGQCMRWLGHD